MNSISYEEACAFDLESTNESHIMNHDLTVKYLNEPDQDHSFIIQSSCYSETETYFAFYFGNQVEKMATETAFAIFHLKPKPSLNQNGN
jgi:hypothetical protein